jgi:hypothetical protein
LGLRFAAGVVVSDEVLRLEVVMIHDWKGHRKTCEALLVGGELFVNWPLAGQYECSMRTGRLKGSRRTRMWRMRRNDLAAFRRAAGWRRGDRGKVDDRTSSEKESETPCS